MFWFMDPWMPEKQFFSIDFVMDSLQKTSKHILPWKRTFKASYLRLWMTVESTHSLISLVMGHKRLDWKDILIHWEELWCCWMHPTFRRSIMPPRLFSCDTWFVNDAEGDCSGCYLMCWRIQLSTIHHAQFWSQQIRVKWATRSHWNR